MPVDYEDVKIAYTPGRTLSLEVPQAEKRVLIPS
jgi:hypothetical protein